MTLKIKYLDGKKGPLKNNAIILAKESKISDFKGIFDDKTNQKIINFLKNNKTKEYQNIIDCLYNFYNNKYNYKNLELLFNFFKNKNVYFVFKYLVIRKLNTRINFDNELSVFLFISEPKYMNVIFFIDFQRLLNLLLYKKKINSFKNLFNLHYSNNYKIYNSQSRIFKIYILLRKNLFFLPYIKKINYFLFEYLIKSKTNET